MKVDVALTPALLPPALPAGVVVVVIDVVRATTTLVTALAAGATSVLPVADLDAARVAAAERGALLAGERGALAPPDFDLGNSPREMSPERVGGRSLVLCTTNGTAAVAAVRGARRILAAALVNAEATARELAEDGAEHVLLLCAGSRGEVAADDVAAAGSLAGSLALLAGAEPSDSARLAAALFDAWKTDLPGLLRRSLSGRRLAEAGLSDDLPVCAKVDTLPLLVELDAHGLFRPRG